MKFLATAMLVLAVAAAALAPDPAFFHYVRQVAPNPQGSQNYLVLDPAIWSHARHDLADLRLYSGRTQVPYVLTEQQSARSSEEHEAKILNLGLVHGAVEFDLDMRGLPEYDRVTLRLSTKNFVSRAQIEGRQELGSGPASQLGTSTVYDFSRENLGSNSTLRFPASTFPYLHVRLAPGVQPKEVQGATIANVRESKAVWMPAGRCDSPQQDGRIARISCDLFSGVPLARILFSVPPDRVNFQRRVTVQNNRRESVAGASISRIRMHRGSVEVSSEDLSLNLWGMTGPGTITINIDNGDDQPLTFESILPQMLERRLYFDPPQTASLALYYGDPKLEPPVYDYARFFREDASAVQAQLGPETQNTAYRVRPDDRPWSERHNSILWIAMLAAVALLAALAIRGMAGSPRSQ
jgi:hypothetical protein